MSVTNHERLHASTVAFQGHACLIVGASGSGKSTLALHLMALGCDLVADDQTELYVESDDLIARCPQAIKGQIEAHSFAILKSESIESAKVVCVIDLDKPEQNRLPEQKHRIICGVTLRAFHNSGIEVLPFAILQYLKGTHLSLD